VRGVLHEAEPAAAGTPILPNLTVLPNLRFSLPHLTAPSRARAPTEPEITMEC